CADVTIVFARGTNEAGNVGGLIGPEFFDAVARRLKSNAKGTAGALLAVQGVAYEAKTATYFLGGDAASSVNIAALVTRALASCPSTKLVMAGYSQGAQLVHRAAGLLPAAAAAAARVAAVVTFGSPAHGKPVPSTPPSSQLSICHAGDNICRGGSHLLALSHFTYIEDVARAAGFVVARLSEQAPPV
ncbi:cutinase, partial [Lasiosphaeria miniovina]